MEDKINKTLVINWCAAYKRRYLIEPKFRIFVIVYGFLTFTKNIGKNVIKNVSSNQVTNVLIMLNNLLQMHLNLLQRE